MGSNCDAGEVAKAFIEAHIKRDFDSFMKYEGRWRITLAHILENTPEFDRKRKKEEFLEDLNNSFYRTSGYWEHVVSRIKAVPLNELRPLKVLQIKPAYEAGESYNKMVYIDVGIPLSQGGKNLVAIVYVSDKYCQVFNMGAYSQWFFCLG